MLKRGPICLAILLACGVLLPGGAHGTEEAIRTPSDQMKVAVEQLGKAPASIGKSLQGLTDAAKERLHQTFGTRAKSETKTEALDLDLPKKAPAAVPADKPKETQRDPFRPVTSRPKVNSKAPRENLSPLERYELSQLKLVGIVWDIKEPRAMIEDGGGLGYVVKLGTPIGNNDGKVKAIHRNEVVVEEFYADDYGTRRKREVELKLSTE
jgi:Tfp pilus assembly protein PilP